METEQVMYRAISSRDRRSTAAFSAVVTPGITAAPHARRALRWLTTIMNVIDYGMDVQAAVDAPRIHHQWMPDRILVEPGALTDEVRAALEAKGHTVAEADPWGAAATILAVPAAGAVDGPTLFGAADARRPAGAAVGY